MIIPVWVPIAIALIAALGAAFSAVGSYKAASATRDAAELGLLKNFLDRYSTKEMAQHLRKLRETSDWIKEANIYGDNLDRMWGGADDLSLDEARRAVKYHFFNIHKIYKTGKLTKEVFLVAVKNEGLNLLFEVVEAIDYWWAQRTKTTFNEETYAQIAEDIGFDHDSDWYKENSEGPLSKRPPKFLP